jgi:4-amino-4-deoxy-L-arabinose transferase-like glycosyltransferase
MGLPAIPCFRGASRHATDPWLSPRKHGTRRRFLRIAFRLARWLLLSLLCSFLFFHRLADRDLWSSHEGRAAQNAATILRDGCWGLPKLYDGHPELQKPPLYYWLVALLARNGTVDAWAVRLPAALSALGGVLLLFGWLAARGRPVAGLVAAVVLATTVHYTWLARVGRIDMPLTLVVSTALICFAVVDQRRKPLHRGEPAALATGLFSNDSPGSLRCRFACLLGYLAIAAAVMLKGPIGIVLPAAVLTVHALVQGQLCLNNLRRSSLWWGVPLVLALTVPWFCWVNGQTNGDFFRVFFLHHNFDRGLGSADDLRVHPWWFYGPRWLIDFFPWSPLVLAGLVYLLRSGRWRGDPEARFGLVWFAVMLALLSCAGFKRADYLLPAYPGAALLLGCVAEQWYRASLRPRRLVVGFAMIVAGCLAGWGGFLHHILPNWEPVLEQRTFANAIRREVPPPRAVHFFRAESHALAFHIGGPMDTFLEWENLDIWVGRPGVHYIVMPMDCAAEWREHLTSGQLVEVLRNTDLVPDIPPRQQMVLMRTDNALAPLPQ